MYSPTWGEFSSVNDWLDELVEVSVDLGINLLLRLHPVMLSGDKKWRTGGINWEKRLSDIEKKAMQMRLVLGHGIDEFILGSDVMVTDVSGMALEFMTLDKPVVFLPAQRYFKLYGSDRPEKWCRPEYEIESKSELKRELMKALEGGGYKVPVNELVYNKGTSLENMVETIKRIVLLS
jgi:CDP-glycerol glycerophosphotransferase (TagB/SpsB family)